MVESYKVQHVSENTDSHACHQNDLSDTKHNNPKPVIGYNAGFQLPAPLKSFEGHRVPSTTGVKMFSTSSPPLPIRSRRYFPMEVAGH